MEIKKLNSDVKCDMGMCRNKATYSIGNSLSLLKHRINLCEDCTKELYEQFSRLFVPKSPINKISNKIVSGSKK